MDSKIKTLLYTTSALVGFSLIPQMANADPVTASIIISSAVSAAGTALMTTGVSVFSYATLKTFAFYTASGFALNALSPKPTIPNFNGLGSSTGNTTSQGTASTGGYNISGIASAADHQVIYGQTRVGGVVVFKDVTDNNKFLHVVYAMAGHECEEASKIYLNNEELTIDGSTNMVTAPSKYNGKVRVKIHLGDQTTGDSDLVSESTKWTSDHKLRNVTYLYLRYEFDADAFPNGEPNLTALIKGKKVFNPNTSATAWSDNTALCLRDYLISSYGLSIPTADIDDTTFGTAFTVCDEDVNLAASLGGGTQKKYTTNGAFTTNASPRAILEKITSCMAGFIWYAQGQWRCKAGSYVSPAVTFTEDDLRSPLNIKTRGSRRDNFNVVRGKFRGAETNFQVTDFPEIRSSTFLTIDNNEENIIDLELPFVNTSAMAQRIAKIALFKNRQQIQVSGTFGMKALQVQVGDVIQLTNSRLGFSAKTFEVQSWTFQPDLQQGLVINLELKEISSAVFDWNAEENSFEDDNTDLLDATDVPSVGISATSELRVINEKVSQVITITTTASASDALRVDLVEVEFKKNSDSDFKVVGTGELGIYEVFDVEDDTYNIRARAINSLGVKGTFNQITTNIAGQGVPPDDVTNFDSIVSGDNVILGWDAIAALDLSFYSIRFSSETSGATWANSTTDTEKVPRPATTFTVPARSGTYMIRAYDKTGVASQNFTSAVAIPTTSLTQFSNTATQTESSSFSGSKTNCSVSSGSLVITDSSDSSDPIENVGTYIFSSDIDVSSTKLVRAEIIVNTIRSDTGSGITLWDAIGGGSTFWDSLTGNLDDLSGTTSQQKDSDVQFFIEPSTSGSFTGTYQRFRAGFFTGRYFRFKIELRSTSTNITPSISTLKAEVKYN